MTLFYEAACGIYVVAILLKKQSNFHVCINLNEVSRETTSAGSYWESFILYETKLFERLFHEEKWRAECISKKRFKLGILLRLRGFAHGQNVSRRMARLFCVYVVYWTGMNEVNTGLQCSFRVKFNLVCNQPTSKQLDYELEISIAWQKSRASNLIALV